jgi:hypothetical protein
VSDPNAKPEKKRVSLTCEARILLVFQLQQRANKDADTVRRVQRVAKALEMKLPDQRAGRTVMEPATDAEKARVGYRTVETPNGVSPAVDPVKDTPREFRLMPLDYGMVVDEIDSYNIPAIPAWIEVLDAFGVGELEDDSEEEEVSADKPA